jgi:hypothetical protein
MKTLSPLALAAALVFVSGCNDKELVCPVGEVDCSGRCVSLLSDEANCGACGSACGPLEACSGGACTCARGVAECGGACTDLARDPDNCGACGATCDAAAFCSTAGGETSCTSSCAEGLAACGRTCVDYASDRYHCGACGNRCADGEVCREGACRAEIYVACYATGDVRPVNAELDDAGPPLDARGSPTALALTDLAIYTANGFPAGLGVLPLGSQLAPKATILSGDDVQDVFVHGGAVFASNAGVSTVVVLDPAGDILDEIVMPGERSNPHGLAITGSRGYVPLFGKSNGPDAPPSGQSVARLDLSGLATCVAVGPGAGGCGVASDALDLRGIVGSASASGYPFPSSALAVGARVFVTLSNLEYADCDSDPDRELFDYCKPAGSGRLAVIDTAAADSVSIVDLGEACKNPGGLAVSGSTLWVSCGSFGFPELAPGALLPVDISGAPTPGAAIATPPGFVPGNLAFCGNRGYVTDQSSGNVLPFDPSVRSTGTTREVCPTVFFAWASDIACSE